MPDNTVPGIPHTTANGTDATPVPSPRHLGHFGAVQGGWFQRLQASIRLDLPYVAGRRSYTSAYGSQGRDAHDPGRIRSPSDSRENRAVRV
jgi:hypothetical protein